MATNVKQFHCLDMLFALTRDKWLAETVSNKHILGMNRLKIHFNMVHTFEQLYYCNGVDVSICEIQLYGRYNGSFQVILSNHFFDCHDLLSLTFPATGIGYVI
jgi:hypothetical protein